MNLTCVDVTGQATLHVPFELRFTGSASPEQTPPPKTDRPRPVSPGALASLNIHQPATLCPATPYIPINSDWSFSSSVSETVLPEFHVPMVASTPPAAEAAAEAKPNQEIPAPSSPHHVEEKNRAADQTTTQTPIPTATNTAAAAAATAIPTTTEPSEKALKAGVAAGEGKTAPEGSSTTKTRDAEIAASAAALSGAEKKETGASPRPSVQTEFDDDVVQEDFHGEVVTNDELPSAETIRRIENYIVLDRHGKTHTFRSLYTGRSVARRVLVIFVRHFFCGVSRPQPQRGAIKPLGPACLFCESVG